MSTVLKPGVLVSLKTTLTGGAHYTRVDIEHESSVDPDGPIRSKWETTRTIDAPEEHARAVKVRAAASNLIRAVCAHTAFGLLCPTSRESELDDAVAQARAIVEAHNATAQATHVHVYVLTGRIAETDQEAMRAIASEVSELLDQMERGIRDTNPKQIRDAAQRAKQLGAILDDRQAQAVSDAVQAARDAARAIVKRIEKDGESAETVLNELSLRPIEAARFAFLDVDDPATERNPAIAMPPVAVQRFAGLDDNDTQAEAS